MSKTSKQSPKATQLPSIHIYLEAAKYTLDILGEDSSFVSYNCKPLTVSLGFFNLYYIFPTCLPTFTKTTIFSFQDLKGSPDAGHAVWLNSLLPLWVTAVSRLSLSLHRPLHTSPGTCHPSLLAIPSPTTAFRMLATLSSGPSPPPSSLPILCLPYFFKFIYLFEG